ncbi:MULTISPECIES: helix-turn-helix domain-containing protein [Methylophaga]|jgi:excisionase family DNA binding protein|uniref:Response regulator n=1 Tax=Methylophaga marina TaxID=45495 RepID=A0ABP3D0U7_9GAMM|nr:MULTISPECIES: helix-turn-helix domain-containing protein [Methylophaga]MAX51156.1 hypothetical protein [Methylophaga sp.]BDZ72740.1 hypothetical protein GCM10025856_04590 [Methylophaga marina]|tara:strand:+ start:3237 stop:3836 length:600 start_codon:yes stop_codon:yes gene_type:complete
MEKRLFTTTQLAKLLGVTARTIQLWANQGLINVVKTLGGHRRISEDEVIRLAEKLGKPIPQELAIPSKSTLNSHAELTVLLVDKDSELLRLYESQLLQWQEGLPTNIHVTDNGFDALILTGRYKPNLIIVDWEMDDMNVAHLVDAISKNKETKHAKIIIVTTQDKSALGKEVTLPASAMIEEKPVSFALIKRLLEKQTA